MVKKTEHSEEETDVPEGPSTLLNALPESSRHGLMGVWSACLPQEDLCEGRWIVTSLIDALRILTLPGDLLGSYEKLTLRWQAAQPVGQRLNFEHTTVLFQVQLTSELGQTLIADSLYHLLAAIGGGCGYDARTRVAFRRMSAVLKVRWLPEMAQVEAAVGRSFLAVPSAIDNKKKQGGDKWKHAKIGAAVVGGGALMAITGGLAAPALAATFAASGALLGATTAATLSATATLPIMATSFGVAGAGIVGVKMDRRLKGVKEFSLEHVGPEGELSVCICIPGLLADKFDVQRAWGVDPAGLPALERLQRFYYVFNQSKIPMVPELLKSYKGHEGTMCTRMRQAYGHDPRRPLTPVIVREAKKAVQATQQDENNISEGTAAEGLFGGNGDDASSTLDVTSVQEVAITSGVLIGRGSMNATSAMTIERTRDDKPVSPSQQRSTRWAWPTRKSSASAKGELSNTTLGSRLIKSPVRNNDASNMDISMESPQVPSESSQIPPESPQVRSESSQNVPAEDDQLLPSIPSSTAGRMADKILTKLPSAPSVGKKRPSLKDTEGGGIGDVTEGSIVSGDSQRRGSKLPSPSKVIGLASSVPAYRVWFMEDVMRHTDQYILKWESELLIRLGKCVKTAISDLGYSALQQGLQYTALAALMAAVSLPMALMSVADMIDQDWTIGCATADVAGRLLADTLLSRSHGTRPVTLIGASLGGRLLFSCLEEMATRHEKWEELQQTGVKVASPDGSSSSPASAAGILENVVFLGAPVNISKKRWKRVSRIVHGRLINAYSPRDLVLGLLYRARRLTLGVAGTQAIGCASVENIDVGSVIENHTDYLTKVPELMAIIGIDDPARYVPGGVTTVELEVDDTPDEEDSDLQTPEIRHTHKVLETLEPSEILDNRDDIETDESGVSKLNLDENVTEKSGVPKLNFDESEKGSDLIGQEPIERFESEGDVTFELDAAETIQV